MYEVHYSVDGSKLHTIVKARSRWDAIRRLRERVWTHDGRLVNILGVFPMYHHESAERV